MALAAGISLIACKKDKDKDTPVVSTPGTTAYLTAKVNGQATNFGYGASAHQNDAHSLSVTGATGAQGTDYAALQLAIYNSAEKIQPQTYTMDLPASGYSVLVTYSEIKADGAQTNYSASEMSAAPGDAFVIKVDELRSDWVSGSFGGTVVIQSGMTTIATADITEGRFAVPIR